MELDSGTLVRDVEALRGRVTEFQNWGKKKTDEFAAEYKALLGTVSDKFSASSAEKTKSKLSLQLTFVTRKLARLQVSAQRLQEDAASGGVESEDELATRKQNLIREAEAIKKTLQETGGKSLEKEIEETSGRSTATEVVLEQLEDLASRARSANSVAVGRLRSLSGDVEDMKYRLSIQARTLPENVQHNLHGVVSEMQGTLSKIGKEPFAAFTQDPHQVLAGNVGMGESNREVLLKYQKEYAEADTELVELTARIEGLKLADKKKKAGEGASEAGGEIGAALRGASVLLPPRVEIFELKPPPIADESVKTVRDFQRFVGANYGRFKWPVGGPLKSGCEGGSVAELTYWQRFAYHYLHFMQHRVSGVLFAASAGAGKSWALALLNSAWLRAGKRSAMITKSTLRAEITAAMFKYHADMNINNLVNGFDVDLNDVPIAGKPKKSKTKKKKQSEVEADDSGADANLTPEERIRRRIQAKIEARLRQGEDSDDDDEEAKAAMKELEQRGFAALDAMKAPYVYPKTRGDYIMSLEQMKNLISGDAETFVKLGAPKELPLTGAFIQIDEAHRAVTAKGELASNQQIDYPLLLETLLKHRDQLPRKDWPVVALHTATPIASYACDVVKLLNLLAPRDEAWMDFMEGHEEDLEKTNQVFLDRYINDDGTMNAAGKAKWDKLAAGRISYISMYGDRSHFAQPNVRVVDVTLSAVQTSNALCCLRAEACKAKKKTGKPPAKSKKKKKGGEDDGGESETEAKQECALQEILAPRATKKTGVSMVEHASKVAPNVRELVDDLIRRHEADSAALRGAINTVRASGRPVGGMPRSRKIFLYVTSKRPKATRTIFEMLKENGFHCLNESKGSKMSLDTTERPYKYYIDHTKGMSSKFHTTVERYKHLDGMTWSKAMRGIFNDKANADGRYAVLFVSSTLYREGISLRGVSKVYVAGTETSRANLIQGVARAVRFCSAKGLPWTAGKGWSIEVYLQRLLWDKSAKGLDPDVLRDLNDSVTQTLQDANPAGRKFYLSLKGMADLLQASAADKPLFDKFNASGESKIDLV